MAFQLVRVNNDWSIPENAWEDIKIATGLQDPPTNSPYWTGKLDITLWQGMADAEDYAVLKVEHTGACSYPIEFRSAPFRGKAYILGVVFGKQVLD